jgi:glycosyltransferase involved in cell wall biosynthesis
MRIVYLNDFPYSLGFGGKEVQLNTYFDFLTQKNYKIERLQVWDNNVDFDVIHLFGSTKIIHSYIDILKNKECKIILSPNFYSGNPVLEKLLVLIFKKFPIPNIFSYRYIMFRNVDRLICNSVSESRQLQHIYKVPSEKIFVFPNGTDIKNIPEKTTKFSEGLPSQYILSVGYFDERKRTIDLITAYKKSKFKDKYKLILVGQPRFASLKKKELFKKITQDDDIIILDNITPNSTELISLYKNAKAHLLPSTLETPGIANLEAASFDLPLFIGDCLPVRDYFGDEVYYVTKDKKDLTEHLNKFLGDLLNYQPRRKNFSWKVALTGLAKIYEF